MNNISPKPLDLKNQLPKPTVPKKISIITQVALAILTVVSFATVSPIAAFIIVASAGLAVFELRSLFLKTIFKDAVIINAENLITTLENKKEKLEMRVSELERLVASQARNESSLESTINSLRQQIEDLKEQQHNTMFAGI